MGDSLAHTWSVCQGFSWSLAKDYIINEKLCGAALTKHCVTAGVKPGTVTKPQISLCHSPSLTSLYKCVSSAILCWSWVMINSALFISIYTVMTPAPHTFTFPWSALFCLSVLNIFICLQCFIETWGEGSHFPQVCLKTIWIFSSFTFPP